MSNKKYIYSFVSLFAVLALVSAGPALAQNVSATVTSSAPGAWAGRPGLGRFGGRMMKPGVFGTVSAISGNTITVSGKQGFGANAAAVTYTVDATNAKIMKNGAAATVGSIAVGDTIMAQGTLTGSNLAAATIRDGQPVRAPGLENQNGNEQEGYVPGMMTSPISGNGSPVVAGTVSAVLGSTLTITNKSNVTYTVDAGSAKIVQGQTAIALSNVAVGDMVIVQGTVNGNSITASSVIDQAKPAASGSVTAKPKGFFGSIGAFFSHIFGF